MPRKQAVSLRQVAEKAGVSRMTVSRAFKEGSSIRPNLRARIHLIAEELGYTPDVMVSELMTNFATRRSINYQETFAAIWWPERWEHVNSSEDFDADIYRGLIKRAKAHGRTIDHFVLTEEMSPRVIQRMLKARNIQGVILTPPLSAEINAPDLDWESLSTVIIGSTLRKPNFHRAQTSHFTAMVHTLKKLEPWNFRKPVLLLREDLEFRMLRAYSAAFLAWGFSKNQIWHAAQPESEKLNKWLNKVRPDVIIADWDRWFDLLSPQEKTCGFVSLAVHNPNGHITGIYQNPERIAQGAIDLLVRARMDHEWGEPKEPVIMLTAGTWIQGKSLLLE